MTKPETTTQETLRDDILAMGCDDFVSMADVMGQISRGQLADSIVERQGLVVATVRSLLADGLVEIGLIPTPNDPGFKAWPGTVDEVTARFIDHFVTHHDDQRGWEYAIWFSLTAKGEQIAVGFVEDQ